jgi:hypothetical protein
MRSLSILLAMVLVTTGWAHSQSKPRHDWHTAKASELEAVLPARAQVEKERIETEMHSATGIVDAHGRVIAAVVLITAGYAANGKYSHYLLAQSSLRIGPDILLPPGAYVIGWTRAANGLFVHVYEAGTGAERGSLTAPMMPQPVTVVPIKIWPPSEGSFIQIGRFMLPYTPLE